MPKVVTKASHQQGAIDDDKDSQDLHDDVSRAAAQMAFKPVIAAKHISQTKVVFDHERAYPN